MFQLFCEGRACCMSNKNMQLADVTRPDEAALQIGKMSQSMFNVDFGAWPARLPTALAMHARL